MAATRAESRWIRWSILAGASLFIFARDWGQFAGGGVLAAAYLIAIIITTGPQYIGLLKRVFGL